VHSPIFILIANLPANKREATRIEKKNLDVGCSLMVVGCLLMVDGCWLMIDG
jgi:hypothetical protein